jgi:hypothetical protein
MRTFLSLTLQDASFIPWVWSPNGIVNVPAIWGINIQPKAIYKSFDENGKGQGEPLYYEWSALLDPADTPLPSWITEVIEPPISEPSADSPGLLTKLKSAIGL